METIILDAGKPENITLCAKTINEGGLVAIPTETVYGLAANAMDEKTVANIFTTKGRQPDNPLIIHIATLGDIKSLVTFIPDIFEKLTAAFWPGPLTLVMKKNDSIPSNVTAGLDTVAIRMPNHPAALALIRESGCPIAAPSANLSGSPSPTKAIHVKNDIGGRIPYILDGGSCKVGLESTVLDITEPTAQILRPGGVTHGELVALLGHVEINTGVSTDVPRSPGMKYRHYAPKSPVIAIQGPPCATAAYIKNKIGEKTAALMFDDYAISHPNTVTFGPSEDYATQAAKLFDALRKLDSLNCAAIYAQIPSENGLGLAVSNRIKKAAANNVIEVS